MINDYLKYLFRSHNEHGVHSPFVYDLNVNVLNHKPIKSSLEKVNNYRKFLNDLTQKLVIEDLGSGSHKLKSREREISEIYKTASCNPRMGEILQRLIQYYNYSNIIEIGTCLGVGTSYLYNAVSGISNANLTTIEGSKTLLDFTKVQFAKHFENPNINFTEGNFDAVLPNVLENYSHFDLALVDGNHTYNATIQYFHLLLEKTANESVIIFDDIYWSEEMKRAWTEICRHPKVTCSIDIFRWGLVFFRKEMRKEHFTLRFDNFLQAHIF